MDAEHEGDGDGAERRVWLDGWRGVGGGVRCGVDLRVVDGPAVRVLEVVNA